MMKKIIVCILFLLCVAIVIIAEKDEPLDYKIVYSDLECYSENENYVLLKNVSTKQYEIIKINHMEITTEDVERFSSDISFVGKLYSSDFDYLTAPLPENERQKLDKFFNECRNSLPINSYIQCYSNYDLKNYDINDNKITMEIENFDGDIYNYITVLSWSLFLNGYECLEVSINSIDYFVDNYIPINETNLGNSTVHYYFTFQDDKIIPYTCYDQKDELIFILDLFSKDNYTYELYDDNLFVNINNPKNVNINELYFNLLFIDKYNNVVITSDNIVLT